MHTTKVKPFPYTVYISCKLYAGIEEHGISTVSEVLPNWFIQGKEVFSLLFFVDQILSPSHNMWSLTFKCNPFTGYDVTNFEVGLSTLTML